MPKSIQNLLKGLLIMILSFLTFLLLQKIIAPFSELPTVLTQNYGESIFVQNGLLLQSRIGMGVLIITHLVIIIVLFGRKIHKSVILRGILGGASFGFFWLISFIELILVCNSPHFSYIQAGIRDCLWLTLTGLYTGIIFSKPKESAIKRSKMDLLAIPLIGLFFAAFHDIQYYLTFPPLHLNAENPVSMLWLFLFGCSVGFVYYLFRTGIKFKNIIMKSFCFSFIIIGINWILNNFFFECEISLPLIDMLIRCFMGIIGIFIGTLLFELIAGKYEKSRNFEKKSV
jgi:hypothetical protein